jgi:hypothetical protein
MNAPPKLSGGAGAPPGDTTIPRQELADGGLSGLPEIQRCGCPKGAALESRRRDEAERRKRGPVLSRRRNGAPRGARVPAKERGTKR